MTKRQTTEVTCDECGKRLFPVPQESGYHYWECVFHTDCGKPGCAVLHIPPPTQYLCTDCFGIPPTVRKQREKKGQ